MIWFALVGFIAGVSVAIVIFVLAYLIAIEDRPIKEMW